MVDALVRRGATTDAPDKNGCTPLFYAVTLGHAEAARKLLDHGANPSIQDKKGRRSVH